MKRLCVTCKYFPGCKTHEQFLSGLDTCGSFMWKPEIKDSEKESGYYKYGEHIDEIYMGGGR